MTGRRSTSDRFRLATASVFVLVITGLLIAGVITLVTDDRGGRDTASFPEGTGRPAVVSPVPRPVGLGTGWNGTAFVNDNLWASGEEQFAVWAGRDGSPVVGRRRLPNGTWTVADLGDIPGNPLASPTEPDPHNVYAVAVDSEGYVHVAGNMHADPLRYARSVQPGSIDEWTAGTMVGTEEASVTYPAFVRAPDGGLLFFYRDGGAGGGDTILNRLAPGADTWQRVTTLLDGRASGESAYLQHVSVDPGRGAIHLMFLWRADESPSTNGDISYARSQDGGLSWEASDGSVLSLPITHATAEVVVATRTGALEVLNQGGLAVDGEGRPHGAFRARTPADGAGVLHVWQEAGAWRHELLLADRSIGGRPAVASGDGGAYLLWTESQGRGRSTLWLTGLGDGPSTDDVMLARLPVAGWEPTFDSVALAERGRLHALLPLEIQAGDGAGGQAAVVTWDMASLAAAFGGVTRHRRAPRSARGAYPPPRPGDRRRRPGRRRRGRRRPLRRRPPGARRPTGEAGRRPTTAGARVHRSWS